MGLQNKSTNSASVSGTVNLKLNAAEARTLLSALTHALGTAGAKDAESKPSPK